MKSTKKLTRTLLSALLILATLFTFFSCDRTSETTATTTETTVSPENCTHDWKAATCVEPSQCEICKTYKDDKLGEHHYFDATCMEPARCLYCDKYRDDKLAYHRFNSQGICWDCNTPKENLQ